MYIEDVPTDQLEYEAVDCQLIDDQNCFVLMQVSNPESTIGRANLYQLNFKDLSSSKPLFGLDGFFGGFHVGSNGQITLQEMAKQVHRIPSLPAERSDIATIGSEGEMLLALWADQKDDVFVLGYSGQVYANAQDKPVEFGPECRSRVFAMDGNSSGIKVVAGDSGLVAEITPDGLSEYEVGMTESFRAVKVFDDGSIFLGSEDGICLRLEDDEVTDLKWGGERVFAIESFGDKLYWGGAADTLYVGRDEELIPDRERGFTKSMHASKTHLLAVGEDQVSLTNGTKWQDFRLYLKDRNFVVEAN